MDKKLGFNLIMSMGYKILTIIVPFITAPYLARVLGATGVGEYTYIQSIAYYFVMFGILGMSTYGNRSIAKVRDDKKKRSEVFWQLATMQLITGLISFLFYVLAIIIFDLNHGKLALLVGLYVMTAFTSVDWFCEGMEKFTNIAVRTVIIKVLNLICIFSFVKSKDDVVIYCVIMSLGYLFAALSLWPTVFKNVIFIRPKIKDLVPHIKPNILLFIPTIAASIYQTMDKIMIGSLSSKSELAYYEYADKIIQIPTLMFVAMGAVMLSRMSNIFHTDESKAADIIGYSMDLSFLIGTSCGFGLAAISYELVTVYYGTGFIESAPILFALTPMGIIYGWANVLRMQYVIPNSKDLVYIIATLAGAVVNLIFNFIFIPKFQAYGATVGTLAAQITVAAVFTIYARKRLPLKNYFIRNIPLFIIGGIMFGIIKTIQQFHSINVFGVILDVVIGGVTYVVLYYGLGILTHKSLPSYIVNIVRRKIERG